MGSGFQEFLVELFEPVGGVGFRKMFGGIGIFRDGLMFALVADDTLYLKADDNTAIDFKAEGSGPFVYDGKDRPVVMQYWRLPERLYDDPDEFREEYNRNRLTIPNWQSFKQRRINVWLTSARPWIA